MTSIQGLKFKDENLFTQAITHRSYLNENPQFKISNERLEFLGDSVLSLIISTELFHRFPSVPEGKLTSLRASVVRASTLAQAAKQLGLGELLLMSRGEEKTGGRQNPSLLANAFEALLGAIYLDQGLAASRAFLEKNLFPKIPKALKEEQIFDFKSHLQVLIQEKNHVSPTYKVISENGPDHDKTFVVGIYVQNLLAATGVGKSKLDAQQKAASLALGKLNQV